MAQEKIVWTILPYGYVTEGDFAGQLRCSIVASPRLVPATPEENVLRAFPRFLRWPEHLAQARFSLVAGGAAVSLERLARPDEELWRALFHDDTPVTEWTFTDMAAVNLRSYSVRNVLRFVEATYGALAVTAGDKLPTLLPFPPANSALHAMLVGLGTERGAPGFDRLGRGETSVDKLLEQGLAAGGPVAGIDGQPVAAPRPLRALPPDRPAALAGEFRTPAEYDFYQANRFYVRPENALAPERRPTFGASKQAHRIKPKLAEPALDFHRILAAFADLPALMRRLGLVIDVALPRENPLLAALAASGGADRAEGTLGLAVAWDAPADPDQDACPRTAYELTSRRFVARARTSEVEAGQLRLEGAGEPPAKNQTPFDVYQVDPDGAALKTVGFLLSAQQLVDRPVLEGTPVTYTTGDTQGVAALRSGGLGVSRHGRAVQVAADVVAAALKNAALSGPAAASRAVVLFAEDVQRGYRVDVLDQRDGAWRSLCARVGEYRLTRDGAALELPPDEGYVKGASTTSGDAPGEHYLHESLFRWTGWSLAAPRPGRTIRSRTVPDGELQLEEVVEVADQADRGTGVLAKLRARPGSLPRLRFGGAYRMRARLVDLAGNSVAAEDIGAEHASATVIYRRFEPVDPPALVLRARLSEGESVERMVIRSDYDLSAADYNTKAGTPFDQHKTRAAFDYTAQNERHVVPPKSSQLVAETHGMFDDAMGGSTEKIARMYELSTREAGTLFDAPPGSEVRLITPPGTSGVLTTELPLRPPSPERPTGDRLVGWQRRSTAGAIRSRPRPCRSGTRAPAR